MRLIHFYRYVQHVIFLFLQNKMLHLVLQFVDFGLCMCAS